MSETVTLTVVNKPSGPWPLPVIHRRTLSSGKAIGGLYAAGDTIGGLMGGYRGGYTGGLMQALVTGILAGENAARFLKE
jgi:succinate dehydrogenase/fumarate reductase flavoprotein subunit